MFQVEKSLNDLQEKFCMRFFSQNQKEQQQLIVSAFGGDQFKLPEQERQLQTFFSVFYFAINAGSLISTILTPQIREDVECFGDDTCYSLAFGIPAILMAVATVIIVVGKPLYVMHPPQGNILTQVVGSIGVSRIDFEDLTKEFWIYCKSPVP